jgi:hypothetical protein
MRYTLRATLTTVVATAPQALNGLISNTCNFVTSNVKYQTHQLYILSEI